MGNHQGRKFSHILGKDLDKVFFVAGSSVFCLYFGGEGGGFLLCAGHAAFSNVKFLIFGEM